MKQKLDFLDTNEVSTPPEITFTEDQAKDLSTLVKELIAIRAEIDRANTELSQLQEREQTLSGVAIPEAMKTMDLMKFTTTLGDVVSYKEEISVSIPKHKEVFAFAFLKKIKADGIIKNFAQIVFDRGKSDEAAKFAKAFGKAFPKLASALEVSAKIHPQTLKAAVRELQEKGVSFPEDGFNIFTYNKTTIKRKEL